MLVGADGDALRLYTAGEAPTNYLLSPCAVCDTMRCTMLSYILLFFFPMAQQPLFGCLGLLFSRFHDHTHLRHTTLGRTPLDKCPARRRDLYLTTHNTHKRQTSMPPVQFEPTIPVSERQQTHALDRTATGIGYILLKPSQNSLHSTELVNIITHYGSLQPREVAMIFLQYENLPVPESTETA
jgi:hypothetical protein